ncbi:RluA family pseudouridine synthase [Bacillus sp. FJAT-49736]|uniref:RluA family pseudouridine synthase n=1 Tax=Bacillus sp. FJAT-49736 TaxID=2833582 RepID=UPI001BC9F2FB|nr:RluA family pseudouridine synthase [Bacillus sp. FJAT-49736]MBS4171802.1 RluA family pseudouridine synthase [Bacillus sp. FJAT-49736]
MKKDNDNNWFELTISEKWNQLSVGQLFRDVWKAPKKLTHQFRMEKHVKVNDSPADWERSLQIGDVLQIALFQEEDFGVIPEEYDIGVLYEDEHLLVANKPAGMETHPNEAGQAHTLANAVAYHLLQKGEHRRVRHIHRLDKDTTGAILFAKHALSHAMLDRMLNERLIKRTYNALVQGLIPKSTDIINLPIGRDRHHPTRRRVSKTGQNAITHIKLLKTIPTKKLSLIECSLDTGRTHQIRVHLSHIGHPLAGDVLYGGKAIFKRPALHARKLTFIHPLTDKKIDCIAPFIDNPPIF